MNEFANQALQASQFVNLSINQSVNRKIGFLNASFRVLLYISHIRYIKVNHSTTLSLYISVNQSIKPDLFYFLDIES